MICPPELPRTNYTVIGDHVTSTLHIAFWLYGLVTVSFSKLYQPRIHNPLFLGLEMNLP